MGHPPSPQVASSSAPHSPVLGDSLMPALVRAYNWTSTPLGPIDQWSETLVATVNLLLLSSLPATLSWGSELTFLYNEAAIPTLQSKHPSALGKSYREVFKEAWHLVGPDIEACFHHAQTIVRENVLIPIFLDGHVQDRYWTFSLIPIFERGRIAGVFNPYQNVTEAILAARDRDAATAQLTQVLGATKDAVVSVNRDWQITYLNRAAVAAYGADRDLVGKHLWSEFPEAAIDGSPFIEHYTRAMNEGIAGSFEAHYPPLNMWIQLEVYPTEEGIVTFSRDISDRRLASAALIQSEKLAAVGQLASSIAHEINNPLEAVTNLLYIARTAADLPEVFRLLDTADQELRRVAIITNQTLRFHKQSSRPQTITCLHLFSTVLSMYEGKLKNAGIQVGKRKRAAKPILIFEGDIRQVLNNLIGNAIDAMPRGGRLLVRSREATNWRTGAKGLVLTIADTGAGIPPHIHKKVFDAFFTTKGIAGTGLGLWISKEIVDRHGGTLGLRSSQQPLHQGTVITLFLPFEHVPADRDDTPTPVVL
jgi:signal transduction histidine kinase